MYGDIWYTQSFQPDADKLTGVAIKVGKYIKKYVGARNERLNLFNKFLSNEHIFKSNMWFSCIINMILQRFGDTHSMNEPLGNLIISVYSYTYNRPYELLRSKTFSPDEINKEADWVKFDFSDNPIARTSLNCNLGASFSGIPSLSSSIASTLCGQKATHIPQPLHQSMFISIPVLFFSVPFFAEFSMLILIQPVKVILWNEDKLTSPTMHHSFRPSSPDLKVQKS